MMNYGIGQKWSLPYKLRINTILFTKSNELSQNAILEVL